MSMLPPILQLLVAAVALVAGIYDILYRRIPNWLVLAALLLGFLLNGFLYLGDGLLRSALGMGLALLIYLPLYMLRGMGAGDVKLMAALGALVGPANWIFIFIISALLGGILAVILTLAKGRFLKTIRNVGFMLWEMAHLRPPHLRSEELDIKSPKAVKLPHGAVIALGCMAFLGTGALLAG
jgi:prepilin peptidase CpaA